MKKKFYVTLKRDDILRENYWIQTVCVIQGLSYGLCSIPDSTTMYDIEMFENMALLMIECTADRFSTFKRHVEEIYPMIEMTYEEI